MSIRELILKNRTFRRFYEDHLIERKDLESLVDLARLSASAANLQPLKYRISFEAESNSRIFPHLSWAGYLSDWPGPSQGERPSAYIVVLLDTTISATIDCDHGIASQHITLGAVEMGLGCCIISAVDRQGLKKDLKLPEKYKILLVIAVGKPKERVLIDPISEDGDVKYWRDEKKYHHVPKRLLKDIILDE
ncbi:MAG: nitroreductase family protein [Proteobacteria bacterium]|nr:nitroreductase family protein [Pseudomonadota bacterium]